MDNRLIPIAVTAAICLAACSNDEVMEKNLDPKGNAIAFSAKVGHSTRAEETTFENLGNFYVFGKSVHPGGSLYSAYLVGSESGDTFTPETAVRKDATSGGTSTSTWSLEREVYLPNGLTNAVFWAFADGKNGDETILSSGTVKFDHNSGPQIIGYKSARANLADGTPSVWADGYVQRDLVSAFGQAKKSDGTVSNNITLNFNHMLSEVIIRAAQKGKDDKDDHRVVKVKGAWIVNAFSKADLSAGYNPTGQKDSPAWSEFAEATQFGSYFKDAVDLSNYRGGDNGWVDLTTYSSNPLMLIPQEVTAWSPDRSSSFKTTTTAYIMLLCRVELKHAGTTHEGQTVNDPDIRVDGEYHYHQQFPVTDTYDAKAYGLTCIPVKIAWDRGKRYTCNLDICGATSGAGIYPPSYDVNDIKPLVPNIDDINIIPIPEGKHPGDVVLDAPIKFTVTVSGWENGEWIDGGGNLEAK